jgi:chromosome segregation ATPase
VQRYIEWSHTEVTRLRDDITTTRNERDEIEQLVQRLKEDRDTFETTNENHRNEATRLTEANQQASTRLETLRTEVNTLETRTTTLQTQLRELRRRGYTDDLVSQIIAGDAVDASELLRRVTTLREYEANIQDAQNALQAINRDSVTRREELTRLTANLRDTEKKRLAVEGQLHRLRDDHRQKRAAITIVDAVIRQYRFTNRDFEHLWRLISEFGTEQTPGQTLDAVSRVLETHRTLTELEAAVEGRRQAHAAVNAQLRTQEQRLEMSRLVFTRLRRQYGGLGRNLQRTIREVGDEFDQTLTHLQDTASQTLTQFAEDGRTAIDGAKDAAVQSLHEVGRTSEYRGIHQTIQTSMELQRVEQERRREEFGQLQAEAGRFAAVIQKANVLLGLKMDTDALQLVSKDEVQLLLNRIIEWHDLQTWDLGQKPEAYLQVIPDYQRHLGVPRLSFVDTL